MKQMIRAGVIAGIGLTGASLLGMTHAVSQSFAPPAITQPTVTKPKAASMVLSQLSSKLDLPLLSKASAAFVQSDRYRTDSEIRVKATSGGTNVTSSAKVTTWVQAPNQFRAEISFPTENNAAPVKSIVISDGKRVWMYRPDLKQYAVTPFEKFDNLDGYYWIGMSSYWYLTVPAEVRQPIANGALANPRILKELGLTDNSSLKGSNQTVDGRSLYGYEYTDTSGFTISALVDPTTADLKQIRLSGKSEGFNVDIAEQILSRTPNPAIDAAAFKFAPPPGAKLVKSVDIGPL